MYNIKFYKQKVTLSTNIENERNIFLSKAININCDEKRHFFCQLPLHTKRDCPIDFFFYKASCFYKSFSPAFLPGAKEQCANRGGLLLDIKNEALYQFIRLYAQAVRSLDLHLGFNLTKGADQLYADGTSYNQSSSYDFGGENRQFGGMDCVYMKMGIGFKPRESDCSHSMDYFCLWTRTGNLYLYNSNM